MNRSVGFPASQPFALAVLLSLACLLCAGCAQMSGPPVADTAIALPPDPDSYSWENTALEASGRASAPASTPGPQRLLVARNAARVAAIRDLKAQVRNLPAGPDGTLGTIMDNYLAVRRAVENQLQAAEMVDERSPAAGQTEVRVRLPLASVAQILRTHHITPTEELPRPPAGSDGMPPVT